MGVAYYGAVVQKSIVIAFAAVSLGVAMASADQVTLTNGDVLNGKVLVVTTNVLTLQDGSLGTLTLPRARISNITFGTVATVAPPAATSLTNTVQNSPKAAAQSLSTSALAAMAREVREHTNLVQEVEAQVFGSSASPEAVNKFNELLDELSSGQMDMNGLRAEAQSAANQLQEYKKEMGQDAGEEVDGYLAILNHFLSETSPTNSASQ